MDDDSCILIPQLLLCSYIYPVPNLEDGLFIGERSKFRRALDQPQNNLADFMVEVCSGTSYCSEGYCGHEELKVSLQARNQVTGGIADEAPGP